MDRIVRGWAWWKDHQSERAGKSDGRQEGSSGEGEGWVDTGSVSEVELGGLDRRLVVGCDDEGVIDFFWPQRPGGLCQVGTGGLGGEAAYWAGGLPLPG